eukprot:Clim_evm83s142 gene=Clim_evmTU83s142
MTPIPVIAVAVVATLAGAALGTDCYSQADCGDGQFCPIYGAPGTCVDYQTLDSYCNADVAICEQNLKCDNTYSTSVPNSINGTCVYWSSSQTGADFTTYIKHTSNGYCISRDKNNMAYMGPCSGSDAVLFLYPVGTKTLYDNVDRYCLTLDQTDNTTLSFTSDCTGDYATWTYGQSYYDYLFLYSSAFPGTTRNNDYYLQYDGKEITVGKNTELTYLEWEWVPEVATNCEMGNWSEWSDCSAECAGGTQTRTRSIVQEPKTGGEECPTRVESQTCNTSPCANCTFSEWSGWSTCTGSGGCDSIGTHTRTRTLTSGDASTCPSTKQSEECEVTSSCGGGGTGGNGQPDNSGSSTNVGMIAGIVAGVAALALLTGGFVYHRRRKARNNATSELPIVDSDTDGYANPKGMLGTTSAGTAAGGAAAAGARGDSVLVSTGNSSSSGGASPVLQTRGTTSEISDLPNDSSHTSVMAQRELPDVPAPVAMSPTSEPIYEQTDSTYGYADAAAMTASGNNNETEETRYYSVTPSTAPLHGRSGGYLQISNHQRETSPAHPEARTQVYSDHAQDRPAAP